MCNIQTHCIYSIYAYMYVTTKQKDGWTDISRELRYFRMTNETLVHSIIIGMKINT